jgi:hypothetical protein
MPIHVLTNERELEERIVTTLEQPAKPQIRIMTIYCEVCFVPRTILILDKARGKFCCENCGSRDGN